jgi:predicted DNA-binding protein
MGRRHRTEMLNTWGARTTWDEVCRRASARRKYHSLRRFRRRWRRLLVSRQLRREGFGYGVKARLARTLGVSKATITNDVRAILATPVGDVCRQRHWGVRRGGQPPQAKEEAMGSRCTIRLPDELHTRLQQAADSRGVAVADMMRQALVAFLDGRGSSNGVEPLRAPDSAPVSPPPPHDCGQSVLARLPGEVRARIMETARALDKPALYIIRSLLIAETCPPGQASPQIPEAALAAAAPPPAAPAPWPSPPATGAGT